MAACLLWPGTAQAHGFGALYNLPVPFWLYGWASAATVIVSFLIAALFLTARPAPRASAGVDLSSSMLARGLRLAKPVLQALAVLLLALCIATGWFGNRDPVRNFSMTFFWIIFLLLGTYLTAMLGNAYAALNPWQTLVLWTQRLCRGCFDGRIRYPQWLADWPALALYLGFIWFELLGHGRAKDLAFMLSAYTALNLVGAWLVGARAWFTHCELFSVFFRLVGQAAALAYRPALQSSDGRARLMGRWPLSGLVNDRPAHLSTVVFILAMLSTTAFDGLKATQWWVQLFWGDPTGWMTEMLGKRPIEALVVLQPWWRAWETFWLLASPLIYLALYWLALSLARWVTRESRSTYQLSLDFAYTLLPIVLVYHLTHYATLVLNHGLKIISLASDPFGWRWDLFGTAMHFRAPILPDMGIVWHSQVGLILFGHVVSIWLAHRVALRVFAARGAALLSQLPMLLLMVAFTVFGLWILAQPLTVMLLR